MNLFRLSASYIRQRKLTTALNVLLLGLGIATIVVLLVISRQFEDNMTRNAQGIDLVVGAKGSPLQLILASIYHMDAPTGNIPLEEATAIASHPAVKSSIPLALGDSYQGYRVVGTEPEYLDRYGAAVVDGSIWSRNLDVVLGSTVAKETGLGVGDEVVSTHGLSAGGTAHGDKRLQVVGVLAPTGSVVDRIITTSVETVWAVHETEEDHGNGTADSDEGKGRELTALLIGYSSPMAAALFPRFVNSGSNLQAASPAFETARLFKLLGIGVDAFRAFGLMLIAVAALTVFIALYDALRERQFDLAVLRSLGASRFKLMAHVLLEGVVLASMGLVAGLLMGHAAAEILGNAFAQARQLEITGLMFVKPEAWLVVLALAVGIVAALLPAAQAYRTDIHRTLAEG